jgi:hypothetical protein
MSRKKFCELIGYEISEAKIAGIENGRAIKPDEEAILLRVVTPGAAPLEPPAKSSPRPTPERRAPTPDVPQEFTRFDPAPTADGRRPDPSQVSMPIVDAPVVEPEGVELLEFGDAAYTPDEGTDDEEDDWNVLFAIPSEPQPQPSIFDLVPEGARLISNSEISTYTRCPRKWMLAFVKGLRPKVGRQTGAMQMGTRMHTALAGWYQPDGAPRVDPRDGLERVLLNDWQNVEAAAGDDELVLQSIAAEWKADADMMRAVIEGYVQWVEETGADEDLEVVQSEAPMVAPLPMGESETPVWITGRMDVRLRRRSDDVRLFMDHKTVGSITSASRGLAMNPQMKQYHLLEILAAQRERIEVGDGVHFEVERTDGALYNMLRRVKRTMNAKPPFYQRVEVRHNKADIASHLRKVTGVARAMIRTQALIEAGYDVTEVAWPVPNDSCFWSCDFVHVCPMMDDGSRWQQFLDENFEVGDPYDRYPELIGNGDGE